MSIIGSLPITLTNGTTADATQVMTDLNYIISQANANGAGLVGGNTFTGTQTINGALAVTSATTIALTATSTITLIATGLLSLSNRLLVTTDGRVYGTALHNNANPITGAVNQYIASGTYSPTLTAVNNVSAVTNSGTARYMRVGNVVTVSGQINLTPTAGSATTTFTASPPIATTGSFNGSGLADNASLVPYAVGIYKSGANANFYCVPSSVAVGSLAYTYTYEVV